MSAFIEARELRKTYRVGKVDVPALRGISFSVQKGEFVTVVGPSGSGKSTLFYLLGGLTHADSGSVTIDGVDFASLSDGDRTRLRKSKIGFVFQKFNLLPTLSARSNIEIASDIAGLGAPLRAPDLFSGNLRRPGTVSRNLLPGGQLGDAGENDRAWQRRSYESAKPVDQRGAGVSRASTVSRVAAGGCSDRRWRGWR